MAWMQEEIPNGLLRSPRSDDGDAYRTVPTIKMQSIRSHILGLVDPEKYQPDTCRAAEQELDYLDDMLAFRALGDKGRARSIREGLSPWQGTWVREEKRNFIEEFLNNMQGRETNEN